MAAEMTDLLRRTDLLRSVPDAHLAVLAGVSRVRAFRRGQLVCSAGDTGDTLMVVISGRVKVLVRSADGGELTLAAVGPGEQIGRLKEMDVGVDVTGQNEFTGAIDLFTERRRVLPAHSDAFNLVAIDHDRRIRHHFAVSRIDYRRADKGDFFGVGGESEDRKRESNGSNFHRQEIGRLRAE